MKLAYTVVHCRRSKRVNHAAPLKHAALLIDPNWRTLCNRGLNGLVIAEVGACITCRRCQLAIMDGAKT